MKKTAKKLTLNKQTLQRLDSLGEVAGGYAITHTCSNGHTCPMTFCVCPQPSAKCTNVNC
jgi:hypothetical protein